MAPLTGMLLWKMPLQTIRKRELRSVWNGATASTKRGEPNERRALRMSGGDNLKRNHRSRERVRIGVLLAGVAVVLLLLYQVGRWLETNGNQPEARGEYVQPQSTAQSIEIDGVSYQPKENLTTILLMGIDRETDQQSVGNRNGGQADFLRLIVIDSANKTVSQLQIDRDTMTPITVLGVLGDRSGIRTAQISLSHGFGDGGEQSCELTVEAVSNLLLNTPIDFYVAMNLDGISELNDLVGGVTVTLEDDFSALDPTMTVGTIPDADRGAGGNFCTGTA